MRGTMIVGVAGALLGVAALALEARSQQAPSSTEAGVETVRNAVTFATVLNAPRSKVWPAVHDAGGWDKWIPFISEGKCNGNEAGSRRECVLKGGPHDGYRLYEEILENNSDAGVFRYAIQNPPFPAKGFQGKLEVREQDTKTLIIWTGSFEAPAQASEPIRQEIVKLYQSALMGLEQLARR